MRVEDLLMSKGTRVITVRMNEPLRTAVHLLRRENIGALVVKDVCGTEGEVVVGMLSERDVVRALAERDAAALAAPVSSYMTRGVIACSPRDEIAHVRALMDRHHIRHVPVLDEHVLVGLLSIRDIVALDATATPLPRSHAWQAAAAAPRAGVPS